MSLLAPNIVLAQGMPVIDSAKILNDNVSRVVDQTKTTAKQVTSGVLMTLLANIVSFVANRLAYDAAVAISSAGAGQEPLFEGQSPKEYFKSFAEDVAGQAIGEFQDAMQEIGEQENAWGTTAQILAGFNVCRPNASSGNVGVALSLGIKEAFRRPEPNCDFNDIKENWGSFIARTREQYSKDQAGRTILNALSKSIDPSSNDFSIAVNIYSDTLSDAVREADRSLDELTQNSGFKPVTDFITGQRQTPAELVKNNYTEAQSKAANASNQNLQMMSANEQAFLQIGINAAQMFTNTLLSRLTQRIYDGVFKTSPKPDPFAGTNSVLLGGRNAARDQYRSYLSFAPLEISNYSLVSDFISCPPQGRGLYNCVMDTSMATALARAEAGAPLTLKEAIEEGFVNGSWPLIPSADQARNQDPYCYTYGYCHANLVKMRKARIIPVGWEIAAESPANDDEQRRITLKEVMENFNNCNAAGELDIEHPWCKLIDPNWVLKYPETQCRAEVYGQLLEIQGSDTRQSECVDMPSCVAENDDGTCAGYGYCTAEENVWRFRGEACEPQYASCRTLSGPEGDVAYLMSTVDQTNCSDSTAGCREYATSKVPQGDTFAFSTAAGNIYFNGKTEKCDAADGGCRELIRRTSEVQLNIVANASFEDDADRNGQADSWQVTGTTADAGEEAFLGSAALRPPAGGTSSATQTGLSLGQGRFYTFSLYAKGSATGRVQLQGADFTGYSVTGACTAAGDTVTLTASGSNEYQRASCTFTAPRAANPAQTWNATVTIQGTGAVDAVEIEQGAAPTAFQVGYAGGAGERLVAKVPPAYLGCTGSAQDPEECANYAAVCSEQDVGCRQFTPENGDPAVTGVATTADVCPNECVGYDAYRQEPTKYEPQGIFPLSFIPSTADVCSEDEVGCSEFTNLNNEAKVYATDLRQCVTPEGAGTEAATFYTWQGSDETGYQLKTWQLLKSNESLASYTHAASGTAAISPGLAPCTNVRATANGLVCEDDTADDDGNGLPDWDNEACDERADIFRDPDCREFYDAAGNIHYRLWSQTTTVDAACTQYRKTTSEGPEICEDTGGYFDGAQGSCRYFGLEEESQLCKAEANGCRAYAGGRSRNSRIMLNESFEAGNIQGWDAASAQSATYSNESLANGGHSLATGSAVSTYFGDLSATCTEDAGCETPASRFGATCTVAKGERYCGGLSNQFSSGKTYTISVLAKGQGTLTVGFDTVAVPGNPSIDSAIASNLALTPDWQQFNLGPVDGRAIPGIGDGTALVFQVNGGTVYLDNIVVREGEDSLALISGSWSTPASCNTDPTGQPSEGYYLGCRAYTDSEGDRVTLKSFSRLCSSDKVGCDGFYLTQESDSPYAQTFANNGTTITVPADEDIFLVMNDSKRCDQSAAGCQELGLPARSADHSQITGYKSTYLVNDPDTYAQILCGASALFCDSYTADDNTVYYFKSPEGKSCEYRTDVQVDNRTVTGWFVKETSTPCYGDYVIGGSEYGLWRNGDGRYQGWVGTCPASANLCTEFQDPLDVPAGKTYGSTSGESYYYVRNNDLEENGRATETECNGLVSLKEGCALFEDPANPGTAYNASATEILSRHADTLLGQSKFTAVQPVVCGAAPRGHEFNGNNLCTQRCSYNLADGSTALGGSCISASDCSEIENSNGEPLAGSCVTVAAESALQNDTDTVLKVNRDRQCSEWLACYSSQQVWDERLGRYRSVCEAVASCTEYGANAVGGCSAWDFSKPAIPLTAERYASRNVTWYGTEYSGYSIPEQIGVEHLSQVDIAAEKTCRPSLFTEQIDAGIADPVIRERVYAIEGVPCETDSWCGAVASATAPGVCVTNNDADYRLVYDAGECSQEEGAACQIGICETSGAPCASSNQCGIGGGECVIGQCLQDTAQACTQTSDCGQGQVCNGIVCANVVDSGFPINGISCPGGSRLVEFAQQKEGSCVQSRCLVAPSGENLATEAVESAVCRAYPEQTAPFAESVVALWNTYTDSTSQESLPSILEEARWNYKPYSYRAGFERANTCVAGEDCSCNYRRLSFGQSQLTKYIGIGAQSQVDSLEAATIRICTNAGDKQGMACTSPDDCNSERAGASDGQCDIVKKEEIAQGQQGFCLERDTSLKINGEADLGACLTWLPVDRIAGATDLSAKFVEAIFAADEVNYCAKTNFYANVGTATACSERFNDADADPDTDTEAMNACIHAEFACPPGMFAVVGAWSGNESSIEGSHGVQFAMACSAGGDNDCPYLCVPKDATNSQGAPCEEERVREVVGTGVRVRNLNITGDDPYTLTAYWVPDPDDFSSLYGEFDTCVAPGRLSYTVEVNNLEQASVALRPDYERASVSDDDASGRDRLGGDHIGWYNYAPANELYLACEEYLAVQTVDAEGAPKTNALYSAERNKTRLTGVTEKFTYSAGDIPKLFGAAESRVQIAKKEPSPYPSIVAQCVDTLNAARGLGYTNFSPPVLRQSGATNVYSCPEVLPEVPVAGLDLNAPQARAFWDFDFTAYVHGTRTAPEPSYAPITTSGVGGLGEVLNRYFARSLEKYIYIDGVSRPGGDDYEPATGLSAGIDDARTITFEDLVPGDLDGAVWDNRAEEGVAPRVWAIDPLSCDGATCVEGPENAITLNGKNNGIQEGDGFFTASVKFYAAANADQLPLRRVVVDWGDGKLMGGGRKSFTGDYTSDDNFFKNARGFQRGTTTEICSLETEWGMTEESCTPSYFQAAHVYSCRNRSALPNCSTVRKDADGLPMIACFDTERDACAFRPRVHIRDNWGFCAGTCQLSSDDDNSARCYAGDGAELGSTSPFNDECDIRTFNDNPIVTGTALGLADPWVYYDGVIYVK